MHMGDLGTCLRGGMPMSTLPSMRHAGASMAGLSRRSICLSLLRDSSYAAVVLSARSKYGLLVRSLGSEHRPGTGKMPALCR